MTNPGPVSPSHCVLGRGPGGVVVAVDVSSTGVELGRTTLEDEELPGFVAAREGNASRGDSFRDAAARDTTTRNSASPGAASSGIRWVLSDSFRWYPSLLAAGVRVERCHDLRLAHAILANSAQVTRTVSGWAGDDSPWARPPADLVAAPDTPTLFDFTDTTAPKRGVPEDVDAVLAEFAAQQAVLGTALEPGRLRLLLAAESAGGLVAVELHAAGVPWDAREHDRLLAERLGPRPASAAPGYGTKPAGLVAAGEEVRRALGDPRAPIDSPVKLLASLKAAGLEVSSTSKWELSEHADHPVVAPLLHYKQLSRLYSSNGWAWMDEWVRDGRFRPVFLPGGVVTGRWAASGGGAMQIPRMLRPALRADPGWTLVSADVAQLEPRVLAAMAGDAAMARAGYGRDLYSGIVEAGIVATRAEAKVAVLGALYGGTTGSSGLLVPRLRRTFPRAMDLVDRAAASGERGGVVSTWLGRSSPDPGDAWREAVEEVGGASGGAPEGSGAARATLRRARDHGRFTRNFVVQGSAAEWALCWMAEVRRRLACFPETGARPAAASGPVFARRAHLAYFLHDEVVVHAPQDQAEAAAAVVRESAEAAGRLLFGAAPVDFPLDLHVAERAAKE